MPDPISEYSDFATTCRIQPAGAVRLMSDVHTRDLFYDEQSAIDWHGLQLLPGRNLKVHYVFRFSDVVLCPNPYARSLALDSLCDGISRELLVSIADTYGATLEMFSFIGVVWYPSDLDVMFSDLEDLPTTFEYLASRLTCVHTVVLNLFIPKDALISLARHAPALKTLLVYEHKILFGEHAANTEIEELKQIISEALGYSWKPLSENDTFYELSGYRQSLLFEDFFLDCLDR
ncbi:uncharacterized protein LOC112565603 [Pomacea canaliculata]|uniref:uncharacterized protein LOC112565603 n=1 Tax=Pomacea canaliculata TaxID=400727 RepID=UPI000D737C7F|nr:uncharacterized protein LOC112565603 [Pomacea canaliculata]